MTNYIDFTHYTHFGYSLHAYQRAAQRGLKVSRVAHILKFGRKYHQKGAIYYSIGRKEIHKYQHICPELKQMNGMHAVCSTTGIIITVFRNQNFKVIREH